MSQSPEQHVGAGVALRRFDAGLSLGPADARSAARCRSRQRPGFGDGQADAAVGSGDDGDAARLITPRSVVRIWSATRSACAAIDSAGLTAAEVGRKPPSTTNRFRWSQARHHVSSGAVGRVVAHAHRAALVRRRALVERPRQHDRIAAGAQILAHRPWPARPATACWCAATACTMLVAVDHDAAFGIGQVLAHQVPVDGVARPCSRARISARA